MRNNKTHEVLMIIQVVVGVITLILLEILTLITIFSNYESKLQAEAIQVTVYMEKAESSETNLPMQNIVYEKTWVYEEEQRKLKEEEERKKEEKIFLLSRLIYVEALGECMEGKIAVGATYMNREESDMFPDEPSEILKAYADISWVTEEMIEANPECRMAAERAYAGEDPLEAILGGPTYYFYNPDKCSQYQLDLREDILVRYRIGNHIFYSEWNY